MRVVDPGHTYQLDTLDGIPFEEARLLVFVKREGKMYPGNVGHHPGTTIQEVLRALIDRVKYLDKQIEHPNNYNVLSNLRHSIWLLEMRAAERHGRKLLVNYNQIETEPTCSKCLHVGCKGECHP